MKRSELRADPEKVRAFQQRGREKAAANAREKPRTGLKRGRPKRSRTCPHCSSEVFSIRWCSVCGGDLLDKSSGRIRVDRVAFRAPRPARDEVCARCSTPERPVRAAQWHHWLPQQQIRVYVRGLRLSDETSRARLRKLLHDFDNLVALCVGCHAAHEDRSRPLSGEEVPHAARVFALRLGPEWAERLRRQYPGGQR